VNDSTEIVRVDDLVKDVRPGFGLRKKRILDGISFRVREREIFGFIGPNGAGKTTTLKVLMGLIRATSGKASILGHDVSEITFRRQIGFLPEQPYFYDYLTGREILRFYAKLSGVSHERRERRVTELLELVGLSAAGNTRLRGYSKGMLQRIGIAQALVHDPQVVFLDEPMSGLDPVGRKVHEHPHSLGRGNGMRPGGDHRKRENPLRGRHRRVSPRRRAEGGPGVRQPVRRSRSPTRRAFRGAVARAR